jgi:Spy/CpxP family protein refolding chaperone
VSPWKVILATMVIFGCGVVTGGLLMKSGLKPMHPTPAPAHIASNEQPPPLNQFQRPEFLRRMEKQLDLTPDEYEQISRIMKDSQERTRPLWVRIAPQLRDEIKRVRQEIRKVLNPKQQVAFDELLHGGRRKNDALGAGQNRLERPPTDQPAETNQP